ncbi:MAG TPA: SpoIID/LytB domain-containing protein [Actinomycetota bacterium]
MRRSITSIVAMTLALCLIGPAALAAGSGTTVPGVTDDPFAGAPPAPAGQRTAERGGFTFYGSGYGHGLGMSQWGSYGLALQGWKYRKILANFYRGTEVQADRNPVKKLRVGLTYDRSKIHLGARSGPVKLWVGEPRGTAVGTIPKSKTWTVKATRTGFAVRDSAGELVGTRWGGGASDLFATYADEGSKVFVPEADAVSGVGYTYNRSHLEFNLYRTGGAWRVRAILPIALEQYLYGIGEMPSSWPKQALQTQAVASRTFATNTVRTNGARSYCNCDITDGANDQVYIGDTKESGALGKRWVHAVDATRKRIVTHNGDAILAVFAASDGGHSDSVEDVWHGGDPAFAMPYLKAECDPGEDTAANPWTDWKRRLTASELTSRLAPYTGGIGTVRGFPKIERGSGGRVITATVKGASGSARVSGAELRSAISAWDGRIWVDENKNVTGAIRDRYDALMCKPGLPTSPVVSVPGGSRQKFKQGGIYRNAHADVTVWLKGSINKEYLAVGGTKGKLGLPTSQVGTLNGGGSTGTRVIFKHGRIYAKSGAKAHALWGPVLKLYLRRDAAGGSLGFPTSRVHGDAGNTTATFEHGVITCNAGGCSVS